MCIPIGRERVEFSLRVGQRNQNVACSGLRGGPQFVYVQVNQPLAVERVDQIIKH